MSGINKTMAGINGQMQRQSSLEGLRPFPVVHGLALRGANIPVVQVSQKIRPQLTALGYSDEVTIAHEKFLVKRQR